MVDSYEYYDRLTRQHRSEPRQWSHSDHQQGHARPARLPVGRVLTLNKPGRSENILWLKNIFIDKKYFIAGGGLGWSQPRMESVIGCVDRRKFLPGYIGGVKIRDSVFAN